jgi:hypothetical protein
VQRPSCSGSCTISWRGRIGKLVALRSCPLAQRQRSVFGGSLADLFGLAGFQLLEPQLELLNLPGQPLRGAAELHPPQLGDLELQLLDFEGPQLNGELCRLQPAVAAASSLWHAKAKARSASGSEGRSAEASDIPRLSIECGRNRPEQTENP